MIALELHPSGKVWGGGFFTPFFAVYFALQGGEFLIT